MNRALSLVTLVVPDYEPALRFYVDGLGFALIEDIPMGDKRWVVVSPGGGCELLLARATTDAQSAAIGNQTGGRVGFFLTTDDFARDYALMRRAGVEFLEEPRSESYGMVVQWADPFGNKWDLLERR